MISKKPSFMVFPAKPTPNVRLPLSECDQRHAWTHTPMVYFYKPSNNYPISSAIDTVAEALSWALVLHYPVAGRLHRIQGGRFELDCNAMGAQLSEAICEADMVDKYGDFTPTREMHLELFPSIDQGFKNRPLRYGNGRFVPVALGTDPVTPPLLCDNENHTESVRNLAVTAVTSDPVA